ncbi:MULTISPECIES: helix-turn-helix domain-containing protein [Oceanisphaera]|uniref:Helix-turn-helix domain-containing protein n=1 Tax=Oceanisphaera ostreae TaxID=914151 RepID=A0ABW3KD13_9GAMM
MRITTAGMLAHAVRDERKKRQLSQQSLAELAAIKQSTISAFENNPDGTKLETLFKLLSELGLELHLAERDKPSSIGSGWQEEW